MNNPFAAPSVIDVQGQEEGKAHEERMAKWLFTVLVAGALATVFVLNSMEPKVIFKSGGPYLTVDEDGNYIWILD